MSMALGWSGNRDDYSNSKQEHETSTLLEAWHFFGVISDKRETYIRKAIEDPGAKVSIVRDDDAKYLHVNIKLKIKLSGPTD